MANPSLTSLGLFIARKQLAAYGNHRLRILTHAFLALTAVGYAVLFALLIDRPHILGASSQTMIALLNVGGAVFVLISGWFPSVKRRQHIIHPVHPIGKWRAASLETGLALLGFGAFCAAAALVTISVVSATYGLPAAIVTVLCWWGAFTADRTLRLLVQRSAKDDRGAAIAFLFSVVGWGLALALLSWKGMSVAVISILTLAVPAETAAALRLEGLLRTATARGGRDTTQSTRIGAHIATVYRTRPVRISLGVAFGTKIMMLILDIVSRTKGTPLLGGEWLTNAWLGTPFIYFTFVFANTYGHVRQLWLTECIHATARPNPLWRYIQIVAPVIIVDIFVSAAYFRATQSLHLETAILYTTTLILLVATGFIASIYLPRFVEKVISFTNPQNSVSMLVTLPVAATVGVNALLVASGHYVLAAGLVTLLMGGTWAVGRVQSRFLAHRMYARLFTED
ncbi:hypothetical protein CRI94_16295 [Longibacter salinarum]|uniref:Uncharacterized protein n=1 Tax=Longibacter salinarum TaxID=1850348 RepID=A0A2A8CUB6_9BACT|nr:hypothetical protein [Longibacter salinarum]PEN11344.1 hypothetical protein CRI94_16295 [Longibacter salinarum]